MPSEQQECSYNCHRIILINIGRLNPLEIKLLSLNFLIDPTETSGLELLGYRAYCMFGNNEKDMRSELDEELSGINYELLTPQQYRKRFLCPHKN